MRSWACSTSSEPFITITRTSPGYISRGGNCPAPPPQFHLPAPLANSRVSARRSPRWGGGDGRQVTVSWGGGGRLQGVFQGKLWYPPLMQAKRTRVKRLSC